MIEIQRSYQCSVTFDAIGSITYSRSFSLLTDGRDTHNLSQALYDEFYYTTVVGQMPWLDYVFRKNPLIALFRINTSNPLATHCFKLLQSRLTTAQPHQEEDFVSYLLKYQQDHPGIMTPTALFSHTMANAIAGPDSTSAALRACIYFLCRHPHSLVRLRNELDGNNKISHSTTAMSLPIITWTVAHNLPYLDAVIKESLRLHPPGSILAERVVPAKGLRVGNTDIPPGTIVGMNGWLTQRDISIFGSDADAFRPERWLPEEGETNYDWQTRIKEMNRAMLVFGHGTRSCIGQGLARLELYKCVPALVQAFDVSHLAPEPVFPSHKTLFHVPCFPSILPSLFALAIRALY